MEWHVGLGLATRRRLVEASSGGFGIGFAFDPVSNANH
jgi:hypothetical protein